MINLADLLQHGTDGVDADPSRAVRLYERVIDDKEDICAISRLDDLLKYGAEGLDADPARALHLYERAIYQNGSVDAMISLALRCGRGHA